MAGAIVTVQPAIKNLHIVEPELHTVFPLQPRYLFLDALGPLAGIGIHMGAERGVGSVVTSSLSGLRRRGRTRRNNATSLVGRRDRIP